MKSQSFRGLCIGVVLSCAMFLLGMTAHAQYTGSFQTNTISGSSSNWVGNGTYVVGSNTVFDALLILNHGVLSNWIGYIGYEATATSNSALVSGTGSVWTNQEELNIGYKGSGNQLNITNNAAVYSRNGFLGREIGARDNTASVIGSGSVWYIANELGAGGNGFGNSLKISAGGAVYDVYGIVSYGGPSNSVLVSGSGSVWSNTDLYLGFSGNENTLTITNGGAVYDKLGYIGYSATATSNSVVVAGSGATWQNRDSLYVGFGGSFGRLTIGPGGSVLASNAFVGFSSSAVGNQINVIGGSLYVTNAGHNAVLDVRCGLVTQNGGLLQVDVLIITNACGQFSQTSGMLIASNLVLDPNLDADGDSLPNAWEQTYGFSPLSTVGSNGANGDPDGDGMNNLQEFLTGTDPTNSVSAFRITTVSRESNNIRVTWMTGVGKTNALQLAAGGAGGSYSTNFTDLFVVTNAIGAITNALDIGGATNVPSRFYRVRLVP